MSRNLSSKYLDNLEDVTRAAVQTKPAKWIGEGEIAPRKEPAPRKVIDDTHGHRAAQLALLAKVKAKSAGVDNIGRAVG